MPGYSIVSSGMARTIHGLEADGDDPQEQVERVARVTGRLDCEAAGVADDPARLVGLYALARHDPSSAALPLTTYSQAVSRA